MSAASKRRYILNKQEYEIHLPTEGNVIAQVLATRGNNLHEVVDEYGETYLVSMPSKFRKTVWIRRDHFLILRPIAEGVKVKAEIEHVLDAENVLYIRENNMWPAKFEAQAKKLTREARRGNEEKEAEEKHKRVIDTIIDEDMLPPSDSDEDSDEEEEEEDEASGSAADEDVDDENEEEDEDETAACNPSKTEAPASE